MPQASTSVRSLNSIADCSDGQGAAHSGQLLQKYQGLVKQGLLREDAQQAEVAAQLASLLDEVRAYAERMTAYRAQVEAYQVCGDVAHATCIAAAKRRAHVGW